MDVSSGAVVIVEEERHAFRIKNIGATGVLVVGQATLKPGTRLQLELTLPKITRPLEVDGVVVRHAARGGADLLGIKFENRSAAIDGAFERFLGWYEPLRKKREEQKAAERGDL